MKSHYLIVLLFSAIMGTSAGGNGQRKAEETVYKIDEVKIPGGANDFFSGKEESDGQVSDLKLIKPITWEDSLTVSYEAKLSYPYGTCPYSETGIFMCTEDVWNSDGTMLRILRAALSLPNGDCPFTNLTSNTSQKEFELYGTYGCAEADGIDKLDQLFDIRLKNKYGRTIATVKGSGRW